MTTLESDGTEPEIAEATLRNTVAAKPDATDWAMEFPDITPRIDPELMDPENPDVVDRVRKSMQLQLSGRVVVSYNLADVGHQIGCVVNCSNERYLLSQKERELSEMGVNPEADDMYIRILDGFEDQATRAFEATLPHYFGSESAQTAFETWLNGKWVDFEKHQPPFEEVFNMWASVVKLLQDCRNRFFSDAILKRAASDKMLRGKSAYEYLNDQHFTFAAWIRTLEGWAASAD